jgi:predicted amidophosphoribosyltransferase
MGAPHDRPEPLGFGRCVRCAYLQSGTPRICFECARNTIEALKRDRCGTCDLPETPGRADCANLMCRWRVIGDDGDGPVRYFRWNYAAAMRSGVLEQAISAYKYNNRRGWARIFARVLVGFLREQRQTFEKFDLIIASPSFVATDGSSRTWDHTRDVLSIAHELSEDEWPFDTHEPAAIIKTAPTERLAQKSSWKERYEVAKGPLRDALTVPDPSRTEGANILVYDDVFTGGVTLNEVARCLVRQGGAACVCGVSLARQALGRRT